MKLLNISNVAEAIYYSCEIGARKSLEPIKKGLYEAIRIPGIIALPSGKLFAYFECRHGYDWSVIDIGSKTSCDGGKTWSELKILASSGDRKTLNNPVAVVKDGVLHFYWCEAYRRVYMMESPDEGDTWSKPEEITDMLVKDSLPWTVVALGPGHATLLSTGRIVIPVWFAYNVTDSNSHHPSVSTAIYSDDCRTWHVGEAVKGVDPSETCIAELPDGRVLFNMRSHAPEKLRLVAVSTDGCETFGAPRLDEDLPDPICAAGMCEDGGIIYFSNCACQNARENLTLKRSADGGATWEPLAIYEKAGYSDVCVKDGHAYVLFEGDDIKHILCADVLL